jgi:hypothetical protein
VDGTGSESCAVTGLAIGCILLPESLSEPNELLLDNHRYKQSRR